MFFILYVLDLEPVFFKIKRKCFFDSAVPLILGSAALLRRGGGGMTLVLVPLLSLTATQLAKLNVTVQRFGTIRGHEQRKVIF